MISIRTHAILDYVIAALLVAAPFVLGLSGIPFASDALTVSGMALAGYSLLSDYPLSFARAIPLNVHMLFDVMLGIYIMAAPFIYGYWPELASWQVGSHFVLGLSTVALVTFTTRGNGIQTPLIVDQTETQPVPERSSDPRAA